MKEIEYHMQNLVDVHQKFKKKDYNLTTLDVHTLENLIEQLHAKLLLVQTIYPQPIKSKVIPQPHIEESLQSFPAKTMATPAIENNESSTKQEVDSVNDEIDEVFAPESKKVEQLETDYIERDAFQLGINERIMFAKELFDDDVASLQESIRKLKSFETKQDAEEYFKFTLTPFLIDEGKDEEIITEFQQIIDRIY